MPSYAVAHLKSFTPNPQIREYLEKIDATLAPFAGRFVVHGGAVEVVEGTWPGHIVIIEFPDRAKARAWYESDAYQEILPLRTGNIEGDGIVADGVPDGYRAADLAATIPR